MDPVVNQPEIVEIAVEQEEPIDKSLVIQSESEKEVIAPKPRSEPVVEELDIEKEEDDEATPSPNHHSLIQFDEREVT